MERLGSLPLAIAVAVHQAIRRVLPLGAEPLEIKWPNDILIGRKKTCGILIEGERLPDGRHALVIGCGINIARHAGQSALSGDLPSRAGRCDLAGGAFCPSVRRNWRKRLISGIAGRGIGEITARWRARRLRHRRKDYGQFAGPVDFRHICRNR